MDGVCQGGKILLHVQNVCMPNKDHEFTNHCPAIQNCLGDKIINKEWHNLCKALEMFPNQTAFVMTDVVCIQRWHVQAIFVNGVKAALKHIKRPQLLKNESCLAPKIFYDCYSSFSSSFHLAVLPYSMSTYLER